jgi:hypothetical protein
MMSVPSTCPLCNKTAQMGALIDVRSTVMAGHVPAIRSEGLSRLVAGTCPAMMVGQRAAGVFAVSWCPRAGPVTVLRLFPGQHRHKAKPRPDTIAHPRFDRSALNRTESL